MSVSLPYFPLSPFPNDNNDSDNILVSIITGRKGHSSLLLSSGTILLMGGETGNGNLVNDVWQSLNGGKTWAIVTASAGWAGKWTIFYYH